MHNVRWKKVGLACYSGEGETGEIWAIVPSRGCLLHVFRLSLGSRGEKPSRLRGRG